MLPQLLILLRGMRREGMRRERLAVVRDRLSLAHYGTGSRSTIIARDGMRKRCWRGSVLMLRRDGNR